MPERPLLILPAPGKPGKRDTKKGVKVMRSVPIYVVALRRLGAKGGEFLLTVSGSPTQIACSADHREAQAWAKACGGQTKRIVVEVEASSRPWPSTDEWVTCEWCGGTGRETQDDGVCVPCDSCCGVGRVPRED